MSEVFAIKSKIDDQRIKVEMNSRYIDQICDDVLDKYTKDLDTLINNIKAILTNGKDDSITTDEFELIAVKIPVYLYSLSTVQEQLGIRSDVSRAFEKEKFSHVAMSMQGTVKEREYIATNETQAESVISIATSRTYKMMQLKIEMALELLASVKKIMSRRFELEKLPE